MKKFLFTLSIIISTFACNARDFWRGFYAIENHMSNQKPIYKIDQDSQAKYVYSKIEYESTYYFGKQMDGFEFYARIMQNESDNKFLFRTSCNRYCNPINSNQIENVVYYKSEIDLHKDRTTSEPHGADCLYIIWFQDQSYDKYNEKYIECKLDLLDESHATTACREHNSNNFIFQDTEIHRCRYKHI